MALLNCVSDNGELDILLNRTEASDPNPNSTAKLKTLGYAIRYSQKKVSYILYIKRVCEK